jgi:ATP-binding cassette subfamily B (MDR/TAP) protein 1
LKGRTTVIIAHRLSTIKNVDLIYVLEGGLVTEKGSHVELIQAGGNYAHLVNAQNLRGSQPGNLFSKTSKAEEIRGLMDQKDPADTPLLRSNTHIHNSIDKELDNLPPISVTERSDLGTFTVFTRMGEHVRDQRKIYLWASIFAIRSSMHASILNVS